MLWNDELGVVIDVCLHCHTLSLRELLHLTLMESLWVKFYFIRLYMHCIDVVIGVVDPAIVSYLGLLIEVLGGPPIGLLLLLSFDLLLPGVEVRYRAVEGIELVLLLCEPQLGHLEVLLERHHLVDKLLFQIDVLLLDIL